MGCEKSIELLWGNLQNVCESWTTHVLRWNHSQYQDVLFLFDLSTYSWIMLMEANNMICN